MISELIDLKLLQNLELREGFKTGDVVAEGGQSVVFDMTCIDDKIDYVCKFSIVKEDIKREVLIL